MDIALVWAVITLFPAAALGDAPPGLSSGATVVPNLVPSAEGLVVPMGRPAPQAGAAYPVLMSPQMYMLWAVPMLHMGQERTGPGSGGHGGGTRMEVPNSEGGLPVPGPNQVAPGKTGTGSGDHGGGTRLEVLGGWGYWGNVTTPYLYFGVIGAPASNQNQLMLYQYGNALSGSVSSPQIGLPQVFGPGSRPGLSPQFSGNPR